MKDNNSSKKLVELKLLTLGDTSVGKSSFIIKFIDNRFSINYIATLGFDFKQKKITINDETIRLKIFDTAGQERFKSISLNIIKKANGVLLLYDIGNRDSFESVSNWIKSIKEIGQEKVCIILIGNKCDLSEEKRKVSKEEGIDKANEYNIPFFETSCKEGININEAFMKLSEEILKKNGSNIVAKGEKLNKEKVKKDNEKSKNCC